MSSVLYGANSLGVNELRLINGSGLGSNVFELPGSMTFMSGIIVSVSLSSR